VNEPLPPDTATFTIDFTKPERAYLYTLLASLYKATPDPADSAVWGSLANKVKHDQPYIVAEATLLCEAVKVTMYANDEVLGKLPEDNVETRVRARAVKAMFEQIRSKIDDAIQSE
jgi:hypothetical protein